MKASEDLIGANGVADTRGYVLDSAARNRADVPRLVLVKRKPARDSQRGSHVLKPHGRDHDVSVLLLSGVEYHSGGLAFGLLWSLSR